MKYLKLSITLLFLLTLSMSLKAQPKKETAEIKRIWDRAAHNAFTDINFLKNNLYIVFREGDGHIPNKDNTGNGKIRILSSPDGDYWESAGLIELEGVDLRDPKISITPKKKMMIVMGGSVYDQQKLTSISTYVSFSDASGKKFSTPEKMEIDEKIRSDYDWLWRVTWHKKIGYGVVYQANVDGEAGKTKAFLVKTTKGIAYELVTELNVEGSPNESTIRFMSGSKMVILMRRGGGDKLGMIGTSKAPYTDWEWEKLNFQLGGPDFEIVPIDKLLVGTRMHDENGAYTALLMGKISEPFKEVMRFPSGGDTSYPGLLSYGGYVWFSYYSSHEGKASIYYTRIPYANLNNLGND